MSTPDEWRQVPREDKHVAAPQSSSSSTSLPPKPRGLHAIAFMDCSPSAAVHESMLPASIGRRGIKASKPAASGTHQPHSASGGKFSFGKCHQARGGGKNSPIYLLRQPGSAAGSSGGGGRTPSLFFGGKKTHAHHTCSPNEGVGAEAALQREDDTASTRDAEEPASAAVICFQDLDLLHTASPVDAAILGMSGPQRQQLQRLMCNPGILSVGPEALKVLSACPALNFLMLSLEGNLEMPGPIDGEEVDLWPELPRLMESLRHVVCLDISECQMKDRHLKALGQSCTQLRALDLSFSPDITSETLNALLAACPNLEELDMSSCPAATSDVLLSELGGRCPKLSTLYIEFDAADVGRRGVKEVAAGTLVKLVQDCKHLQVLSLAGLPLASTSPDSRRAQLAALAQACPLLTTLDVTGCEWPRGVDFDAAPLSADTQPPAWPSLKSLSLTAGRMSGEAALRLAVSVNATLTSLTLHDSDTLLEDDIFSLVQALPHLTELALLQCSGLGPSLSERLQAAHTALKVSLTCAGVTAALPPCQHDMDVSPLRGPQEDDDGNDGGDQFDPMSVTRPSPSANPASSSAAAAAAASDHAAGSGAPSWGGLMSFLSEHVGDLSVGSCQKGPRPEAFS